MTTTGVVTGQPDQRWQGGTLTVTAGSGDTVLLLDDAADFAEDFTEQQWLIVGEETAPREYVAVANDEDGQQSVTLAGTVGGSGLEAGLPIYLYDPTAAGAEKRAIEHVVAVRLDDGSGTAKALVDNEKVPLYSLDGGASVEIEEDGHGEWWVLRVLGRVPVIGTGFIDAPFFDAELAADESIPTGTDTVITTWTMDPFDESVFGYAAGVVTLKLTGLYQVTFAAKWEANTTGRRSTKVAKGSIAALWFDIAEDVGQPSGSGDYASSVTFLYPVTDQEILFGTNELRVSAFQNSGGALDLLGVPSGLGTTWQVLKLR